MSNRTTIETIKQKLPIESVVGSYIKLERMGKNFKARCPFHTEKTASFQVTPDLGIYKCFGCQKGGDIFAFVQEIEGVTFYEALVSLAEKAGVTLERGGSDEKPSKLAMYREIMNNAAKFYEVNFRQSKEVVDYLLGRGMTKDTMVSWRIGFAPKGWSNAADFLKKKYSAQDIISVGLGIQGDRGVYDRFRERIMFPISDGQGRVVAFTGRVMPGTEEEKKPVGKYINSPETDLYHKSNILFGFDKAKSFIHSENFAVLVEGQMDCVMSHQAGFKNTVAISGTAATDEQMKMLGRFTEDIAIALDADAAGLAAAQKTAIVAYRNDMKVSVIDIPNGKDPADTIKENPDLWKDAIASRKDFITFRLQKMNEQGGDKLAIAKKELFPILREFKSQIRLDDKMQEIARAFKQSSVEPVRKDFEEFLKINPLAPKAEDSNLAKAKIRDPKGEVLGTLLAISTQSYFEKLRKDFEEMTGENYSGLLEQYSETDRAQLQFSAQESIGDLGDETHQHNRLRHLILQMQLDMLEADRKKIEEEMAENPGDESHLRDLSELLKKRDQIIHNLTK